MKKLMKSLMLFAAAAMALTSCENEAMNEGIEANDTYTMNFVAGAPESKTSVSIDGNNATFSWDDAEEFVFIQNTDGETTLTLGTDVTFTKNGEVANISATFTGDVATEYNHVAIYPASAWVDGTEVESSNFNEAKLTVKNKQALVSGNYDPSADLMVSKAVTCVPTEVPQALQFTRLVSVAEMNIKNLDVAAGEKIVSVDFAVSESVIAGRNYYDLATGKVVKYGYSEDYRNNNITLSGEGIDANNTSVKVYFTCNPVTIATGETYTVTVTTDKAKYTKSAELTKDLAFEAGKVKAFGVNMDDAKKESVNDLSGAYIIVAKGSKNYYYMSTWKDGQTAITGGNNRTAVDSSVSEITDYTDSRVNFGDAIENYVWNVSAVEGGYTFANKDYTAWLYLDSNQNRAQMTTTESSAGVFTIDKNNETNIFTVVDKTYNRTLAYNSSSALFACYTSGQNPSLYFIPYVEDSRIALDAPVVSASAEGKNVTVSWGAVTNAGSYTLTYGDTVVENATSPYEFEGEYGTTYNFSVVAIPSDDTTHKNSVAGTTQVTTEADPNVGGGETSGTVTYDFSKPANYGITAPTTGNGTEIGNASLVAAPITMTTTDGSSTKTRFWNSSGTITLRVYKNGGSFTFTADSGYTITGIDLSGMSGTISTTVGYYSNNKWTGSANSVTFTVSATATLKTATITYEGGETPDPDPTPTQLAKPAVDANVSGNTITLTWAEVANASSYTVTYGTTTIENATSPYVISDLAYSATYEFNVVAVGDGTNYTDSEADTASATTEAEPSDDDDDVPVTKTATFDWVNGGYTTDTTTITVGDITWTGSKGTHSSTSARIYNNSLRTYDGNTVKFEAADGFVITSITGIDAFNFTGSQQVVEFTGLTKKTYTTSVVVTYQSAN